MYSKKSECTHKNKTSGVFNRLESVFISFFHIIIIFFFLEASTKIQFLPNRKFPSTLENLGITSAEVLQVLPIVTPLVFGISLPLVLSQQMHVADHPALSLPNGLANYSCTYCFHRKQNVKSCTTKVNSKYIAFNMVYVPKRGCRFVVNSCY